MPIVGEGNDVHVEYTMPEHIRNLVTDDFLKEFRNQLFRIHDYYSLDLYADHGIPMNTSTAGWFAAFGKACLMTHKEEVLDYWRTLPWYDSDIFDGELADMLVERKFILDDSSKVIGKLLGINPDDIVECCDCGKIYTKDMMHIIRLYMMVLDILENEKIVTFRENEHDLLMRIRNGEYVNSNDQPLPEFYEMVNEYEKRVDYAKENTSLPDTPDYNKINEFVMSVNERIVKGEI